MGEGERDNGKKRPGMATQTIAEVTPRTFTREAGPVSPDWQDRDAEGLPGSRGVVADAQQFEQLVQQLLPPVNKAGLLLRAFAVGGTLSVIGQFVLDYFTAIEPTEGQAIAATLATMILLGAVLTALGVYDFVGQIGGFGAAVPITGFANSIVSAAMDFRREGFILGMGSKMFVIAGPVIVFGIIAGMLAGSIAWLFQTIVAFSG